MIHKKYLNYMKTNNKFTNLPFSVFTDLSILSTLVDEVSTFFELILFLFSEFLLAKIKINI